MKSDTPLRHNPIWVVVWVRLGLWATAVLSLGIGVFIRDWAGKLLFVIGVVAAILAMTTSFVFEKLLDGPRRTALWRRVTMGSIAVLSATIAILGEGFPQAAAIAAAITALIALVTLEVADVPSSDS